MDKVIIGIEGMWEQGVLSAKRAGGCGRCQRHHLTGASEFRRQISVTSRDWGASRGLSFARGWFEQDREQRTRRRGYALT